MKNVTIEVPTVTDYVELVSVWEASVRATHDFLKEEDILFYKPLILNEYLKAVDLFCIKDNDTITGFMGLSESSIEMLFIHPAFRGSGIGKTLLQFAINELKINKVDVNEQNDQALGFYLKMGFKVVNRSELDGMGKPYPILHMELNN
ncbi:putative N-acetyltransferase YjaB [compost metagenome]